MNYREQQLRLILKQHQNKWEKERDILQHDIWTLENSTDLKLLNQAREKQKELQEALDNLVALLGKADIKNLTDLRNLLKGKTLKELITSWENKYKLLGEEKDEEIEAQIIKQTELEALRQDQQKELKKEIDTQQKELIERTREIWNLEKKQEQTFKELREREEQLTNTNQQLKEQKGVNTLYNQKITDLDNQLINLAKQKIKSQKEAQALLNQLEANWKTEKTSWQQEKTNLITNHQQAQDKQAQDLAQERKDFYGQIERLQQVNQELTTNLTEKGKVISEHLSSIKDLEAELTNKNNQVKKMEEKRLQEQEEHDNEKKYWNQEASKQQELYNQLKKELQAVEKDSQGLFKQLQEQKAQTNLKEQEIQLKNKKIKEMGEWSKGQHNRIVELEAQAVKDKEQIKAEANKQVQAQLADQITQIKKATGLDTVMNKFISFETLLEKVKKKLEKGSKTEEVEEKLANEKQVWETKLNQLKEEKQQVCDYLSSKLYKWLLKKKETKEFSINFPILSHRRHYDELFIDVLLKEISKTEQKNLKFFNSHSFFGESTAQEELDKIMSLYFEEIE